MKNFILKFKWLSIGAFVAWFVLPIVVYAVNVTIPQSPGVGNVPVGNANGTYTAGFLAAGANITISTSTAGRITITASGGSAAAGGSNLNVQFNSSTALQGSNNFSFDGTSLLWLNGTFNASSTKVTSATSTNQAVSSLTSASPVRSTAAGTLLNGAIDLSSADASGVLAAARFPALTGDLTTSAGALGTTLATVNSNVGTYQGITVNGKGLVTAATNQNYLTANQTITLSGDISGSGATAITTAIGAGKVTNAMLQNAYTGITAGNGLTGGGNTALGATSTLSIGTHVWTTNLEASTTILTAITNTNATSTGQFTSSGNAYFTGLLGQSCLGTSAAGLLQAGTCGSGSSQSTSTIQSMFAGGSWNSWTSGFQNSSTSQITNLTATNATSSALVISAITGSTQCLHVDTNGKISGTGSDCGTASGIGGTIANAQVAYGSGTSIAGSNNFAWINGSNILAVNGTINATSTSFTNSTSTNFTVTNAPYITAFNTAGVVHNSSAGLLSSSLIVNADITNSTIDLTAKVTGILPVGNGGTGFSTLAGASIVTASAVAGQVPYFTGATTQAGSANFAWINGSSLLTVNGTINSSSTNTTTMGIGTTTPAVRLVLQNAAGTSDAFRIASSTGSTLTIFDYQGHLEIATTTDSSNIAIQGTAGQTTSYINISSSTGASVFRVKDNATPSLQVGTTTASTINFIVIDSVAAATTTEQLGDPTHPVCHKEYEPNGTALYWFFNNSGSIATSSATCKAGF